MGRRVLATAVAVTVAVGCARLAAGGQQETYTVTADVERAPNLFEGGRVMVRGVEVGRIAAVTPRPQGVRLTLEIRKGVPLPAGARLAVVPITVIADRYVQLTPYRSGPRLRDGAHIPLSRTSVPVELDEALAQLRALVHALGRRPGQRHGPLARLLAATDRALAGRSARLGSALEGSARVLGNLASSHAHIAELVGNLDRLFIALADSASEIGLVNERFALVATALREDREALEGTIENLADLSDQAAALVDESGDRLGRSFDRLATVLGTLLRRERELTQGMQWTNAIAQAVGAVDASGRGLYAYTGRQAEPGTAGAAYNYRIDQRDTVGCRRIGALADSFLRLNPSWGVPEVTNAILTYVPDFYDDHLRWLVELLVPPCSVIGDNPALDARARWALDDLARRLGERKVEQLLGAWFAASLPVPPGGGQSP